MSPPSPAPTAGRSEGTWGRSHVNLDSYASPGDTIQLRWEFGNDGCTGVDGWYVDDVTVYACLPNANPTISINDISVTEGNSGTTNATFTVSLSHASDQDHHDEGQDGQRHGQEERGLQARSTTRR